jgi:hypothetical protein
MRNKILGLALSALAFSISYAFVEYYVIRDTSFGYNPVLFSLIYPYHFAMFAVFGLAAYGLLSAHVGRSGILSSLILVGALISSMLAVEDFTWFALRAVAPISDDSNAGRIDRRPLYRDTKLVLFGRGVLCSRAGNEAWQAAAGCSRKCLAVTCL